MRSLFVLRMPLGATGFTNFPFVASLIAAQTTSMHGQARARGLRPARRPERYPRAVGTFSKADACVRTKRMWLFIAGVMVVLVGFTPAVGLSVAGVLSQGTLARAGRGTRAWLREVALASDDRASFRVPAVPAEALWRVVEDPAAASTARAGAALALRARLDDEGRTRLRVLADACAAPRLRVALQQVASTAEAEALEEAFEALQDDEHRAEERRA